VVGFRLLSSVLSAICLLRMFIVRELAQTFIIVMQASCAFFLARVVSKRHHQTSCDKSNVKRLRRESIGFRQYNSTNRLAAYVHYAK